MPGMHQPKSEIKNVEIEINLRDLINKTFKNMWYCKDRYLILYGGRGSSKSEFAATLIVYKMLFDPYFKGYALRRTDESILGSSYETIVNVIDRMGVTQYFDKKVSPKTITCIANKNKLLFSGFGDSVDKIKSTKDLSFVWYEEDLIDNEADFTTISTTIRSAKAPYLQEIFTINPVIEDYESHWFYKKFFEGEVELSFRKEFKINVDGQEYLQKATIHHSTFRDNRWLDNEALANIQLLAKGDPYLYQVYNLGIWCNKHVEGRFFSKFDIVKNGSEKVYDPIKPLHCSFDFNRKPYSACTIFQVFGNEINQIDEICILNKNIDASAIKQTCLKISSKYSNHVEGMYIYGDPSGRQQDSKSEKGFNNYTIITDELSKFKPQLRVATVAPSVKMSGEFINTIFNEGYKGYNLYINNNCKETIKDLLYLKIDKEGGKFIEKMKDSDGSSVEKYGHCTDSLRYYIISYLNSEFSTFLNPSTSFSGFIGKKRKSKHRW